MQSTLTANVDNSKSVLYSIASSLQRVEYSVRDSMHAAVKLMDKKVALQMGSTSYAKEGRESYSSRSTSSRLTSRAKISGQGAVPDVVLEVVKRAKIRNLYAT